MTGMIEVSALGGPEVLEWVERELPAPGAGEVQLRHTAIGLNFIDTYQRTGLYPVDLPFTPGCEGAGIIKAVGDGVTHVAVGDRVAYAGGPLGAYSEARNLPADKAYKLPDGISDEVAAAMMLKGCTVEFLVRRTYPVKQGDTVLFHAAAGGVGLIAGQWLSAIGATAIGTAGGPEKCALAKANGYTHVIDYTAGSFKDQVMDLTDGKGVPVVYDSVGKDTFIESLDCLQPRGMMVSFGNATGPVDPVPPAILAQKGSLFLTRPILWAYYAERAEALDGVSTLFELVESGQIKIHVGQTFALKDVADAHRALGSRQTTGSTVLIP